jgi:methionine-rich copper-binding protein CopC
MNRHNDDSKPERTSTMTQRAILILRAVACALVLAVSSAGVTASVATAHDVVKGPNGGQVVDDGGHHVEFTTKDSQVVLYLTDNADKPLSSIKATGRVIVQVAGKQATADLVAAEPNQLIATLAGPLKAGAKLVISIKLSDGHDVKARFSMR